jgi:TPR repeat protein
VVIVQLKANLDVATVVTGRLGLGGWRAGLAVLFACALLGCAILFGSAQAGDSFREGVVAYQHRNYRLAVAIFAPLANRGDPEAQAFMGVLYYNGQGVPQNYTQAAIWYRRAAEQGHSGAQFMLGQLYDTGQGVPEDIIEAQKWLILAAAGADGQASNDRARVRDAVRTKMTRGEIAQSRRRAMIWVPRPEH